MKTKSFLLGAAALMLATACSNDEVVKVAENSAAIGFKSFVNKSTRGAEDLTYANVDDLQVWGVTSRAAEGENAAIPATEIFAADGVGQIVEKKEVEAGNIWTYSPLKYWIAGNAYSFAAIAPYTVKGLSVDQNIEDEWSEAGLSLTFDNGVNGGNAEKDLLYATANITSADANQAAVELNLKHLLSRVMFTFNNNLKNGETIKIVGLTINNATEKASIKAAGATAAWTATTGNLVISFDQNADKTSEAGVQTVSTEHKYIIPTGEATYEISFTIEQYSGENLIAKYPHTLTLNNVEYKKNFSYNFVANIDNSNISEQGEQSAIQFKVNEFEAWEEFTDKQFEVKKSETSAE